jgi:hypothetical protein
MAKTNFATMSLRFLVSAFLSLASVAALSATAGLPLVPTKGIVAWADLGRATPTAAFVTANWANLENKPDIAIESVRFSDEDLIAFETIFSALPENSRSAFKTPQRMAAMVMGVFARRPVPGKAQPVGCEILTEEAKSADEVLLSFRFNNDARVETQRMKKFEDGWKLMVPSTGMNDKRRRDFFAKTAQGMGAALKL